MSKKVTFWFDVACPFCWVTSRWMKEVEKVRDVDVDWVPMSLAVLNEGRDLDPDYAKHVESARGPARIFAWVKTHEPDKVDALYTALGTKAHNDKRMSKDDFDANRGIIAEALKEVGLDEGLVAIGDGTDADEDLARYHQSAMDEVGGDVGTPVVKIGESAFFGPVITRVPRGEEAGALFDGAYALGSYPHFFELKRSRTEGPDPS